MIFRHIFQTFFHSLNNREIAIFIWVSLAIVSLCFSKNIRSSLLSVIHSIFAKKIIITILSALIYSILLFYTLYKLGLWEFDLLKTSTFWFLGTAMAQIFTILTAHQPGYFKRVLRHSFKWSLIIEFIISLNSFSLPKELILIPVISFLGLLVAFASNKQESSAAYRFLQTSFNCLVGIVVIVSLYLTIQHYRAELTIENLKDLLLSPVMTILLIPYIYFLALYSGYENLFLGIRFRGSHRNFLQRRAKWIVIKKCTFNLDTVKRVQKMILMANFSDKRDFEQFIERIKQT